MAEDNEPAACTPDNHGQAPPQKRLTPAPTPEAPAAEAGPKRDEAMESAEERRPTSAEPDAEETVFMEGRKDRSRSPHRRSRSRRGTTSTTPPWRRTAGEGGVGRGTYARECERQSRRLYGEGEDADGDLTWQTSTARGGLRPPAQRAQAPEPDPMTSAPAPCQHKTPSRHGAETMNVSTRGLHTLARRPSPDSLPFSQAQGPREEGPPGQTRRRRRAGGGRNHGRR